MKTSPALLGLKLKLSMKAVVWVLSQWRYALLAVATALLFFEFIFWMFNLDILFAILGSNNVGFIEKIRVLASPIQSIAVSNGRFIAGLMVVLSLVQGINIAVLVFTMRHQQKTDPALLGGSSIVGLLALLGLGCPACGTSLITPVVAIFASTSAVAISEKIMFVMLPVAIAIGLYGIYVLGLRASSVKALHFSRLQGVSADSEPGK